MGQFIKLGNHYFRIDQIIAIEARSSYDDLPLKSAIYLKDCALTWFDVDADTDTVMDQLRGHLDIPKKDACF